MTKISFDCAALQYLNQWITRDRGYHEGLHGHDHQVRLQAIRDAAVFYKVARSLPRQEKNDKSLIHYEPLLRIITQSGVVPRDQVSLIKKLKTTAGEICKAYSCPTDVLSLTTKMMWFWTLSPVVIYDRQVREALGTEQGDLQAFYSAWHSRFNSDRAAVKGACATLHEARIYAMGAITEAEIKKLANQYWFQARVFDAYLWHSRA
jgi:hypothetical protein